MRKVLKKTIYFRIIPGYYLFSFYGVKKQKLQSIKYHASSHVVVATKMRKFETADGQLDAPFKNKLGIHLQNETNFIEALVS